MTHSISEEEYKQQEIEKMKKCMEKKLAEEAKREFERKEKVI